MKLSKIVYENTWEKFKIHCKQQHESVSSTLEETKLIVAKNEQKLAAMLAEVDTADFDDITDLTDELLKNTTLNDPQQLSITDKIKSLPKFNTEKFH